MKYFYRFALMGAFSCFMSFAADIDQTLYGFRIKSYRTVELTDGLREKVKPVLEDFRKGYYASDAVNSMPTQSYRIFLEGKVEDFFQKNNERNEIFFAITAGETEVLHCVGVYYFESGCEDVLHVPHIGIRFSPKPLAPLAFIIGEAFYGAFPRLTRISTSVALLIK